MDLLKNYDKKDPWSVFSKKTQVPEYDDPFTYNRHDIHTTLVYMSPREYINTIVEGVSSKQTDNIPQKDWFTHYTVDRVSHTSIHRIRESLTLGHKLWLPYLKYEKKGNVKNYAGQEGIHRALVAYQLGMEQIPVLIVTESK